MHISTRQAAAARAKGMIFPRFFVGAFSLRSTQNLEDGSIVLQGSTCVKDVKVFTNNDTKYISIMFNEEGQEAYKNSLESVK